MVCSPLLALEGLEPVACSDVAAIVTAGKLATTATPPLPNRNRRREAATAVVAGALLMRPSPALGVGCNGGNAHSQRYQAGSRSPIYARLCAQSCTRLGGVLNSCTVRVTANLQRASVTELGA